jgi:SAM-dependent methyltransferase
VTAELPAEPLTDDRAYVEISTCALCGCDQSTERLRESPFRVVWCCDCGLTYVTPRLRPDLLPLVYDETYWTSPSAKDRGYTDYRAAAPLYLKTFEKRYALIDRIAASPGRALDVGCAAGYFMKVLSDHGWQVEGVELSATIAQHARDEYGLSVHVGELATAQFENESFDLVTMWDVVEHVPDPLGLVRRAAELLKPKGAIVIETQNIDSLASRLLRSRWHHFKHMEHLYHFNPATISRLLKTAGFQVERSSPRLGGKHVSVAFVRERATRLHPALDTLLRTLRRFDDVDIYVNLLDEMVVVGRKD